MCQRCNHLIVAAHRSAVQFQRHVRVHAACARRQLHLSRSLCCSCLLLRLRPQFPRVCATVHGRGARTRFPAFSLRSPLVSRIHRLPTCAPSSALRTCSHFPPHFPPHPARGSHLQIVEKNRRAKFNRAYTQRFFQITAVFAIATIASSEFLSPAQVRLDLGFFGAAKARKRLRTPTPLRLIHLTPQPNRSFWTKRPTLPASACSLFSCPVYLPP